MDTSKRHCPKSRCATTPGTSEVPGASAGNTLNVSFKILAEVEFTGGRIVKVVIDVADDVYVDVEKVLAAALARD